MKRLVVSIMLAGLASTSVAAGSYDYVYVAFGDLKQKVRTGELKEVSVCAAKRMVAEQFDLEMRKFELRRSGRLLNGDKTLAGDYVTNGSTLTIKPVSSSYQCR